MDDKNSFKERTSPWERISSISVLLIALIGAIATFIYNEKQSELQEIEAVRQFFQHLISENKKGWAYLGTYVAKDQHWETRYFEFDSNRDPKTFVGKPLKVRKKTGALNVRNSMPDGWAIFGRIIDILQPGSEVEIQKIQAWSSTGYMWALIDY